MSDARVSVVIPVLNEQAALPRALESTRLPGVERIVVDGGSRDGSTETARFLRAERVLHALPGRAHQLDAGYREASAPVVLFLHADTRLEVGWLDALEAALRQPRVQGGAFRLVFESPRPIYRAMERVVALRCRWAGLPYGDQGLFARRALLRELGGIAQVPLFEDLDLVRAIRARGELALLDARAFTSPRRYERNGVLRQIARNNLALLAWRLDLDRDRVARWYRGRPVR